MLIYRYHNNIYAIFNKVVGIIRMTPDWKTLQSNLIHQDPWIKLYQDKVETRSGKTIQYAWYKSSDVAVIVPS
jgi:hypothetical protein